MAGFQEYDKQAKQLVQKICKPAGCVYANVSSCGVKYSDEVVKDFVGDGCMSAAVLAPGEKPFVRTQDYAAVIPVQILADGSVHTETYGQQTTPLTRREHHKNLQRDPAKDKVIFKRQ